MKLVINVRDELYKGIERCDGSLETEYVYDELMKAVCNGIPLPKGHGRLVDADAILEGPYGNTYKDIDIAETIIEADEDGE